jgi:hypothetical protein
VTALGDMRAAALTAAVRDSLMAAQQIDAEASALGNADELAHLLVDLADLKRAVVEAYKTVERLYVETSGERKAEIPGVGVVEIRKALKRTQWQHDELWRTVVSYARDERQPDEDGVYEESEAEVIARTLRECLTPSWKVTGLQDHGIDPSEFCQVEEAGYSVRLPGSKGDW